MNKLQVGDVVRVANLGVGCFGYGELIVSRVDRNGLSAWISIEGYPQDGTFTYMESVFELVNRGVDYNE